MSSQKKLNGCRWSRLRDQCLLISKEHWSAKKPTSGTRYSWFTNALASLLFAALAAGGPSTQPATKPAEAAARRPWSRYEVVVDRDIFMRHPTGAHRGSRHPRAIPESSRVWVLSGTVLTANDRVAFLENTRTGSTIRAHEGDSTDAGVIVRIDADHFDLSAEGQTVSIPIGSALDGTPRETVSATQPATEPDEAADVPDESMEPATSATPAPPADSIEARMRARREQELSHH